MRAMQGQDEERVRKMLGTEEVPQAIRDVYFRVQQRCHSVQSGPLETGVLALLCEIAGYTLPDPIPHIEAEAPGAASDAPEQGASEGEADAPKPRGRRKLRETDG